MQAKTICPGQAELVILLLGYQKVKLRLSQSLYEEIRGP
jgi:hypothetical protein